MICSVCSYSSEIRSISDLCMHTMKDCAVCEHAHNRCDSTVYRLKLKLSIGHTFVHVPISWMDLGQATSAAVHNYSYHVSLVPRPFYKPENRPARKGLGLGANDLPYGRS